MTPEPETIARMIAGGAIAVVLLLVVLLGAATVLWIVPDRTD